VFKFKFRMYLTPPPTKVIAAPFSFFSTTPLLRRQSPRAPCLSVARGLSDPQAYPQKLRRLRLLRADKLHLSNVFQHLLSSQHQVLLRVDGLRVNVRVWVARLAPK
jgi:hypothetical protein